MARTHKYTPEQVIQALEATGGYVSGAAKSLNTTSKTICDYINKFPEVKQAKEDIEERYLDMAESSLMKAVREGKTAELIFFLKTKGKKRGYIERVEQEQIGDTTITINKRIIGNND